MRSFLAPLALVAATLFSSFPLPTAAQSQRVLPANPASAYRAEAVREAFRHAWTGYRKYAFPHDEVKPDTYGFDDSRNGWGATAVDALSTAILMGHQDIVEDIIGYIPYINWSRTTDSVSLFETTIRYLGGLLSAHDLLTGPYAYWGLEVGLHEI
jgi:mannosyl-oligosaccharide alpha-1,2-mannosidase